MNDIDPVAARTWSDNGGAPEYDVRDVADVTAADVRAASGGEVVGFLGCPPCQGWSAAGARGEDDPRNRLLMQYFRLLDQLKPAFFVMENVPAVVVRPEARHALAGAEKDYRVWSGVLNAAAYGLPQTRQRTIVIGYRRDLGVTPTPPLPTHAGRRQVWDYAAGRLVTPAANTLEALLGSAPRLAGRNGRRHSMLELFPRGDSLLDLADFVTVGEALDDLPAAGAKVAGVDAKVSAYAKSLGATVCAELANHFVWRHADELTERMRVVPVGGRASPPEGKRYYSQAYARLHPQGLSRTITTNFHNPGSGRYTHHVHPRTLTVREAARLQGFRDAFAFAGYRSQQERQVGNAFPPLWAHAIALHVLRELEGSGAV